MKRLSIVSMVAACVCCWAQDDSCEVVANNVDKVWVLPEEVASAQTFVEWLQWSGNIEQKASLKSQTARVAFLEREVSSIVVRDLYPSHFRALQCRANIVQVLNNLISDADFLYEEKPAGATNSCEMTLEEFNTFKAKIKETINNIPSDISLIKFWGRIETEDWNKPLSNLLPQESDCWKQLKAYTFVNDSYQKICGYWAMYLYYAQREKYQAQYLEFADLAKKNGTKLKVYLGASKLMAKPRLAISHAEQVSVDAPAQPTPLSEDRQSLPSRFLSGVKNIATSMFSKSPEQTEQSSEQTGQSSKRKKLLSKRKKQKRHPNENILESPLDSDMGVDVPSDAFGDPMVTLGEQNHYNQ